MKQFEVKSVFRDKYTDEHYCLGVLFLCDDTERITDLQQRGLIGEEIPLTTSAGAAEEASVEKEVKPNVSRRKASSKDKS